MRRDEGLESLIDLRDSRVSTHLNLSPIDLSDACGGRALALIAAMGTRRALGDFALAGLPSEPVFSLSTGFRRFVSVRWLYGGVAAVWTPLRECLESRVDLMDTCIQNHPECSSSGSCRGLATVGQPRLPQLAMAVGREAAGDRIAGRAAAGRVASQSTRFGSPVKPSAQTLPPWKIWAISPPGVALPSSSAAQFSPLSSGL